MVKKEKDTVALLTWARSRTRLAQCGTPILVFSVLFFKQPKNDPIKLRNTIDNVVGYLLVLR